MGARLVSHVHVYDDRGQPRAFGPDDEVPEWAARLMGAHCFENGEHPLAALEDGDGDGQPDREPGQEPPRSGKGSGRDAWVAFAHEKGLGQLAADASRDELVQRLVEAGAIDA